MLSFTLVIFFKNIFSNNAYLYVVLYCCIVFDSIQVDLYNTGQNIMKTWGCGLDWKDPNTHIFDCYSFLHLYFEHDKKRDTLFSFHILTHNLLMNIIKKEFTFNRECTLECVSSIVSINIRRNKKQRIGVKRKSIIYFQRIKQIQNERITTCLRITTAE